MGCPEPTGHCVGEQRRSPINIRNPVCAVRQVNFVEVMAPCLSRDALELLLPTFLLTRCTWGIDYAWSSLLEGQNRIHRRRGANGPHQPIDRVEGPFYRRLRSMGIDPDEELAEVQRTFPEWGEMRTLEQGHRYSWQLPGLDQEPWSMDGDAQDSSASRAWRHHCAATARDHGWRGGARCNWERWCNWERCCDCRSCRPERQLMIVVGASGLEVQQPGHRMQVRQHGDGSSHASRPLVPGGPAPSPPACEPHAPRARRCRSPRSARQSPGAIMSSWLARRKRSGEGLPRPRRPASRSRQSAARCPPARDGDVPFVARTMSQRRAARRPSSWASNSDAPG